VRRDGQLAGDPPPGSWFPATIVAIEAGEIVPADGRLLKAATPGGSTSPAPDRREPGPSPKATKPVAGRRHRRSATGDRHGVHETPNVTRGGGRVRRHRDRDGHRGRPHLRDAAGRAAGQDPARPPDGPADGQILVIAGIALVTSMALNLARGEDVHRRLQRRRRLRHRCDPRVGAAHGNHDHPRLGDGEARRGRRDHETAGLDPRHSAPPRRSTPTRPGNPNAEPDDRSPR